MDSAPCGIANLPGPGVTCDEAYANLFFGERYFDDFRTLDPTYLNPFACAAPRIGAWPALLGIAILGSYRRLAIFADIRWIESAQLQHSSIGGES